MANVLAQDITINCAAGVAGGTHGGTLSATGTSLLRVDGNNVLTQSNVLAGTIKLCGNDPASNQVQCTQATSATAATRLFVDGKPVVLDTITGPTNGTPPGVLKSKAGHDRLRSE